MEKPLRKSQSACRTRHHSGEITTVLTLYFNLLSHVPVDTVRTQDPAAFPVPELLWDCSCSALTGVTMQQLWGHSTKETSSFPFYVFLIFKWILTTLRYRKTENKLGIIFINCAI